MNLFIEQDENAMNPKGTISDTDVYSEEERKTAWMRETRIGIFMQMELEACRDELDWLIICYSFAADNCPKEEYTPRPLPIPPDYIDNLQRRLGNVMKRILQLTLKMVLKTYYQAPARPQLKEVLLCAQEKQLETSLGVQPDDMTGKHRDGDHNLLERPQVSEKKEKLVSDVTSPADQGGDFVFQTEVGMNLEISKVAAHHFELTMFRQ